MIKILLENASQKINWWVRSDDVREGLLTEGHNPKRLPNVQLDTTRLNITNDLSEVVSNSSTIFLAIPSAYIGDTLELLPKQAYEGRRFVSAIKGVMPRRKKSVSMFLEQTLGVSPDDVCVISGPSHAEEVGAGMPTFLTVASRSRELYENVEQMLSCSYIHTRHTTDIDGVECCGLGKNIYAIAAGICQGLGYGDNLNAVLTTAAFSEMKGLIDRYLPNPERDMNQPCYLGDLMVTCWSRHSRNRRLGELVALGHTPEQAFEAMGTVAEGYYSVKNMHELSLQMGIYLPIAEAVYRVMYEKSDPRMEIEKLIADVL